jgi:flavin reductase (DIM6/NTAB) family NADH-FMN oxidoreductase RutF
MKQSLGSKTLAYPTPVWCVGSYDKNNAPNVMTAAWGGYLLFQTALCYCVAPESHLYVRKYCDEKSVYGEHSV